METESILLPKKLTQLITSFLTEQRNGKITLVFKGGKITTIEISEHLGHS